ncbi:hypothetical protein ACOSP7_009645 [Xanthoceras sorbifolium]|uniref:Uncharacterized protein n=1 Tax=Xanthoceras sorbifolium TaxID=99658 RepID=A0ABQ8HUI2_9ROSI|nr:hypothetical protein JRO89_XS07G0213100 [Xanthoceras sorbifolium]
MGSIGEEELDQMVRDYIELAESPSTTSLKSSKSTSLSHQSTYLTLQEVIGKHTDDEVEIREKISIYLKNMSTVGETRNQKKWVVMKLIMDGYESSLCKTTWDYSTFSCPKGNYEYIEVTVVDKSTNGEHKPTRLIVDMDFRSQFEVARPTRNYKELINTLPIIFVGTEEKLNKILSLLCPASKQSLKEKGLHIPPWRSATYMQSKWLSKNCKKVSFSTNNEVGMDQSEEKSSAKCCPFIF